MVTVIFFSIVLLGITFMAFRTGIRQRLYGVKLRVVPVYRRPAPRPKDWPAVWP